jgi:hypothetical protein
VGRHSTHGILFWELRVIQHNKIFLAVDLVDEAWYALFTMEPGNDEELEERDTGVIAYWNASEGVFIDESCNSYAQWDIAVRQR